MSNKKARSPISSFLIITASFISSSYKVKIPRHTILLFAITSHGCGDSIKIVLVNVDVVKIVLVSVDVDG